MFVKRFFCRYWRYILTLICGCAVITTGPACGRTSRSNSGGSPLLIITSVASSNISEMGATITWSTNRPADSQVEYGVTTSYGNVASLARLDTSHLMDLFELTQGTLYHYRVKSRDEAGNLATSGDLTFTTKSGSPPPPGATFYVSPTGSDSNPGTQAQPFRTIQKAADVVNPGNTVIVEDGVYSGSNQCSNAVVCLTRGGSAGQLVTFKSRNKWGAKIDGQNGVAATGFAFGGADYVRIQDFEIYGVADAGGSANGIEVFNSGRFSEIVGNHIHDVGHVCTDTTNGQVGIYIEQNNVLVDGNRIHDIGRFAPGQQGCQPSTPNWTNHDHGIYHSSGDDVTIRNNIVYRTERGWAIQAYPNSRARMNILNNTFAFTNQNQGKYGAIIIYDGMTVSDSNISNNIFYQVNGAAIYVGGSSSPSFSNVLVSNNIVQNGAILRADSSVGTGLTFSNNRENTDPGMVDPASYNFRLQASSLAIDSGVAVPVPTDHEGLPRPQGGGYDIGAYEYSSSGMSSHSNIGLSFIAFNPIRITSASISQGAVALTGASPPGRSAGRRR